MNAQVSAVWPAGLLAWLLAIVASIAAGCSGDGNASEATTVRPGDAATNSPVTGEIVVFAASSLTDAFKEAASAFESHHPGASITFSFAASSALAAQINEGAKADVFASADNAQMAAVTGAGNAAGEPVPFTTNVPVVVVPRGSTAVASFRDLAKPGVKLVLAAPEVPAGRYSREIFALASGANGGLGADFADRALANLQSNEANVRAVLAKVQLGEADAGIVYSTDAAVARNEVTVLEIPRAFNVAASYPIVALSEGDNTAGAQAWIEFILSAEGQAILQTYGFGKGQ